MRDRTFIGRAAAVLLWSVSVVLVVSVTVILGRYLEEPGGPLADIVLLLAGFLTALAAGLALTGWGLLRDQRWAWEATALAAGGALVSGVLSATDPRPPGASITLEAALVVSGVLVLALVVARWIARDRPDADRPA